MESKSVKYLWKRNHTVPSLPHTFRIADTPPVPSLPLPTPLLLPFPPHLCGLAASGVSAHNHDVPAGLKRSNQRLMHLGVGGGDRCLLGNRRLVYLGMGGRRWVLAW